MVKYPVDFNPLLQHIQTYFGKEGFLVQNHVYDVATKILVIPPNKERNYALYVTLGMSESPMFDLPDFRDLRGILSGNKDQIRKAFKDNYAEMLVKLPPDWPLPSLSRGIKDNDYFWPIQCLFELADYVHEQKTIFRHGHTFGYDKNFTFAKNTQLAGWLFIHPPYFAPEFAKLKINPTKIIHFMQLIPLYLEEILFAEDYGSEILIKKLKSFNISDHIDINRQNICKEFHLK